MDLGGVNRIKPRIPAAAATGELRTKTASSGERDAHGHGGYQKQERPKQLSPEQETEGVAALNALPSFVNAGLVASLVKGDGKGPHVVVKDRNGQTVRYLPYEQIVELYFDRKSDRQTGRLINRAA